MIDGNQTTMNWQAHTGDICILPVGSVEQHGAHLPLTTDCLAADYFARLLADELDAALLPVQPYANCLEHSGFRGSLSLRPETLMLVIRDLADEVERQGFRILILLNGHGGNLSLAPVVRDLNRQNRPLKLLLVPWWEFIDPAIAVDSAALGKDIHAGEIETSVMLAITPKLVGPDRRDMPPPKAGVAPLLQSDLNTFGTGHFNPEGPIGFPSFASAAKGQLIVASVRQRMPPFVRERIARLRRQPDYAGAAGLLIRTLTPADLPGCMRLKTAAGWNQTEADWQFLLAANPAGCFGAVHQGQLVGTTTALLLDRQLAWIGMVLVDPACRGGGIGRRLMEAALQHVAGCPVVKLDATALGKPLYLKLGFQDEYELHRLLNPDVLVPAGAPAPGVVPLRAADLPAIAAYDRQIFGLDRTHVLANQLQNSPDLAFQYLVDGQLRGYCLGRQGAPYNDLGPVVAETLADAQQLVTRALHALAGRPALLDVANAQRPFLDWLTTLDFTPQRSFSRMYLGNHNRAGDPTRQFAIAGPELG